MEYVLKLAQMRLNLIHALTYQSNSLQRMQNISGINKGVMNGLHIWKVDCS